MTKTYATYLPIFTGFYGTIFDEFDRWMDYEFDNEECFFERYEELQGIPFNWIQDNAWDVIDTHPANLAVVQELCDVFPSLLPDIVKGCEFEKMNSPREYNFTNDSCDCKITVDLKKLQEYLKENESEWESYLKKTYTSCDGFISSYGNTLEEWQDDTENYTELDGHYLGSILQFIAENEMDDPQMDLYYAANISEVFCNNVEFDTVKLKEKWEESLDKN